MISVYLHLLPFHNFLCIFSFKKRKVVLIFVVEEKQRHHCNPTVIWKIYKDHFFEFRFSIIVTMT